MTPIIGRDKIRFDNVVFLLGSIREVPGAPEPEGCISDQSLLRI